MSKSLTWRSIIALFAILAAVVYLVPSLTVGVPGWWSSLLPKDKIRLGLDLQGGMHLVLEVQASKAVETHLERVVEELKRAKLLQRPAPLPWRQQELEYLQKGLDLPDF